MPILLPTLPDATSSCPRRSGLSLMLAGVLLGLGLQGRPAEAGPPPYPDAVRGGRLAARAVLDRAGVETCLRGKLTRALLELSASCEVAGQRNDLCSLADRAVVVTPMDLPLMAATAQQLLDLSAPTTEPGATPLPANAPAGSTR